MELDQTRPENGQTLSLSDDFNVDARKQAKNCGKKQRELGWKLWNESAKQVVKDRVVKDGVYIKTE